MNDNQRSREALSLRKFFDDQISHLQNLLTGFTGLSPEEKQQAEADQKIVENVVDASNSKIRAAHNYAQRLRGPVRRLYDHVHRVADAIPPPISLARREFGNDPLVSALFVSGDEIEKLLKSDPVADDYLRAHSCCEVPVLYALLMACKSIKRTLGVAMAGDVLLHDVPMDAVNFSRHRIQTPCADADALESALREYLFNRVVALARLELKMRMDQHPVLSGADSYESRIKSLANPDVYLSALVEYLDIPDKLLSIDKTHYKLSKLGIKLENDDPRCANEFDIHELAWGGNSREVVLRVVHAR